MIEMSTYQETLGRSGRKLVTRVTSREANRMTHVIEVGTAEGATVLDMGAAESDTVRGCGVLDPGGGIGDGRIDVQCQGHTIEKGKIQDEADRGLEAARKIREGADHGLETARQVIHSVRAGTLVNGGGTGRDLGKEVEINMTAEPRYQREISTVQWRHWPITPKLGQVGYLDR